MQDSSLDIDVSILKKTAVGERMEIRQLFGEFPAPLDKFPALLGKFPAPLSEFPTLFVTSGEFPPSKQSILLFLWARFWSFSPQHFFG